MLSFICDSKIGKKFSRETIEALQRSSKKTCEEVRSQIDEADRIYKQETIFKILNLLSIDISVSFFEDSIKVG